MSDVPSHLPGLHLLELAPLQQISLSVAGLHRASPSAALDKSLKRLFSYVRKLSHMYGVRQAVFYSSKREL